MRLSNGLSVTLQAERPRNRLPRLLVLSLWGHLCPHPMEELLVKRQKVHDGQVHRCHCVDPPGMASDVAACSLMGAELSQEAAVEQFLVTTICNMPRHVWLGCRHRKAPVLMLPGSMVPGRSRGSLYRPGSCWCPLHLSPWRTSQFWRSRKRFRPLPCLTRWRASP